MGELEKPFEFMVTPCNSINYWVVVKLCVPRELKQV